MSAYTWLVTGASSGLGAEIALAALRAGHAVIGTARNIPKAQIDYPDIEKLGGSWLKLDVTSPQTESIVAETVRVRGVNVLVNNAGYSFDGPFEAMSLDDIRKQFETNVFGAFAVMKGCIPIFRERRNGTIVNMSSTAGITPLPTQAAYASSKFALEGASEVLAAELAPFNIRVLIVEPGLYRTNFSTAMQTSDSAEEIMAAYAGTPAEDICKYMRSMHGKQPGDPVKAGQVIVEVVTGVGKGKELGGHLRLLLGKSAVARAAAKAKSHGENVDASRSIAEWAVYPDDK